MRVRTRVARLVKPTTVAVKSAEVARVLSRADLLEINESISPKIRQNEQERTASMSAAAKCIVGGKS